MAMNYIKKLERLNEINEQALTAWDVAQRMLEAYLTSDKFHEDTTVQVGDVLHRLAEVRAEVGNVLFERIEVLR